SYRGSASSHCTTTDPACRRTQPQLATRRHPSLRGMAHFPQRPGAVGAGSGPLMTVSPRPWLSHRVMAAWAGAGNTIAWWRMQPRPSLTSRGLFFGGGFGRERKHIRFTAGRGRPRLPQDQQVEGKGPVVHVTQVQWELLLPWQVGPAVDLPQAGQPRPHGEAL